MATATVLTRGEWDARAEALAEQRGARGTAQYLHECADGRGHVYRVPSRTDTGSYDVVAWGDGRIECPCAAGVYGRPCCHAGAALHAEHMRQVSSASSDRDPAGVWAWWLAGSEWGGGTGE